MSTDRTRRRRDLALAAAVGLALAASACIPDVVPNGVPAVEPGPSCDGAEATCGPSNDESCCAGGKVAGGDFNRINDTKYNAHVSAFVLDRFEVTVGRFRAFVGGYAQHKPAKAAGLHPHIPGSGWDPAWDALLPADEAALRQEVGECSAAFVTWTDAPDESEELPVNCVSWYVAFAFCAWDGGRLPTEAEWNYAAAGGKEQRPYPWGDESAQAKNVPFACSTSLGACVRPVGAVSPEADGLFGQADLAGSMGEWTLDYHGDFKTPCSDCATLVDGGLGREARGGDFSHGTAELMTSARIGLTPEDPVNTIGIRCARDARDE